MSCSSQNTAAAVILLITALSIIQIAVVVGFTQQVGSIRSLRHKRNFDAPYTSTCAATSIEERGVLSSTKRSCNNDPITALRSSAKGTAADAGDAETNDDALTEEEIDESMEYLASLIKAHLDSRRNSNLDTSSENIVDDITSNNDDIVSDNNIGYQLAKGRFIDLTTTLEGEHLLERLFDTATHNPSLQSIDNNNSNATTTAKIPNKRIIQHAITTLQSLLIYGIQIGVKGSEESQQKMVRHLFRVGDAPQPPSGTWIPTWNADCIRRLKFFRDVSLGKLLLAKLIRKRTAQGAFDLLVDMGVWDRHVDTALLRSGFPVRFLESELEISKEAERNAHDPDEVLGLRRDMREQKVYTIDSASTLDIDDGIAVEVLEGDDGNGGERHRYWIHIADVDRYAPRGSELLSVAERRGTSLYLPTMTLCMFPPK